MKKQYVLETVFDPEFNVLALNSHIKAYKLCWLINKKLCIDFAKIDDHVIPNQGRFVRYSFVNQLTESFYDILVNRSKDGFLIKEERSINFFLKIQTPFWDQDKKELIKKLKEISEILLIFELDLKNQNYTDKFIFNDKKN